MKNIGLFIFFMFPIFVFGQEFTAKVNSNIVVNQRGANFKEISAKLSQSDCKTFYEEIENELDRANHCEQDSDCKTMELGGILIQFDCFHFVNNAVDTEKIHAKMVKYYQQCGGTVDNCAPSPKPTCIKNKCKYIDENNTNLP